MGVSAAPVRTLDGLVRLARTRRSPLTSAPLRLSLPGDMSTPLGCDAVEVPAGYGRLLLARLPRAGCVYADGSRWWWIVPSDSDVALQWPEPAHYTTGALVPDVPRPPGLIHRPDAEVPYTPPIPLYLALCRLTGTPPAWTRPVVA
ncbi:hypothetical protein HUT18_05240 [Streptomyces sp. NA04227]|uniref:hypothetical protein n=1 Tax=Streptomyces sp. NA04227 TaxID=2742136 RepID=UPI0015921D83|nr:hypothetical protein [Streptomyces sp. NA04227]QKW05883.1 hypothetical protein HUT18_05240 [Streptomyces sp. NA04227]